MQSVFFAVSVSFLLLSLLTIVVIIRDVLPVLNPEDQNLLRNYWMATTGFRTLRHRDQAIRNAWNEHVRLFPQSCKRVLFRFVPDSIRPLRDGLSPLDYVWSAISADYLHRVAV
jgi:hypothetical protein